MEVNEVFSSHENQAEDLYLAQLLSPPQGLTYYKNKKKKKKIRELGSFFLALLSTVYNH